MTWRYSSVALCVMTRIAPHEDNDSTHPPGSYNPWRFFCPLNPLFSWRPWPLQWIGQTWFSAKHEVCVFAVGFNRFETNAFITTLKWLDLVRNGMVPTGIGRLQYKTKRHTAGPLRNDATSGPSLGCFLLPPLDDLWMRLFGLKFLWKS